MNCLRGRSQDNVGDNYRSMRAPGRIVNGAAWFSKRWPWTGVSQYMACCLAMIFSSFGFADSAYVAKMALPGSRTILVIEVEATHHHLAEYSRRLVLYVDGLPSQRMELFPDTGGYSRAQLYQLPDGFFYLLSYFDAVLIDPVNNLLSDAHLSRPERGKYLGAFDMVSRRIWAFIPENESAEQVMLAGGG